MINKKSVRKAVIDRMFSFRFILQLSYPIEIFYFPLLMALFLSVSARIISNPKLELSFSLKIFQIILAIFSAGGLNPLNSKRKLPSKM